MILLPISRRLNDLSDLRMEDKRKVLSSTEDLAMASSSTAEVEEEDSELASNVNVIVTCTNQDKPFHVCRDFDQLNAEANLNNRIEKGRTENILQVLLHLFKKNPRERHDLSSSWTQQ